MQHEINDFQKVFTKSGQAVGGVCSAPLFLYNKENFKENKKINSRLCFFAKNDKTSLFFSIEKIGNEFLLKIIFSDKEIKGFASDCIVKKYFLSLNKIPVLDAPKLTYSDDRIKIGVINTEHSYKTKCEFKNFAEFSDFNFELDFLKPTTDSHNLVLPFEEEKNNFYYKTFLPNTVVLGKIFFGKKTYNIEQDACGYFMQCRYLLPYRQIYRSLMSVATVNGENFAISINSRLGDDKNGEENCFFYKGKLQKLSRIKISGTDERIDRPWTFQAGIKAVDITFTPNTYIEKPLFVRCDKTTIVYGTLNGELNRINSKPIALTNVPAHMIFTVI